jgi:hypothetical protein
MPEKMLTVIESFRTILRARYPSRPALADEIQDWGYFHSARRCFCRLGWIDPEVEAAADALAGLKNAIASQSVRLHGRRPDDINPTDINPTEITRDGIWIFDNVLDVWQPTTRVSQFQQLPIYLNVHCYAADIEALIGTAPAGLSRRLTKKSAVEYVEAYIKDDVNPTIDGFRARALADKIKGARKYEKEFRGQMLVRGHIVRRGRRKKPETLAS